MPCPSRGLVPLLVALVAFAAACPRAPSRDRAADGASAAVRATAPPATAPAVAAAPPPAVPVKPADGAAGAASQPVGPLEPIGLEPCDSYLAQHHRCITRQLPAELRPLALQGLASTRAAWQRALRANEVARLRLSCAATADTTRKAMQRYGCRY